MWPITLTHFLILFLEKNWIWLWYYPSRNAGFGWPALVGDCCSWAPEDDPWTLSFLVTSLSSVSTKDTFSCITSLGELLLCLLSGTICVRWVLFLPQIFFFLKTSWTRVTVWEKVLTNRFNFSNTYSGTMPSVSLFRWVEFFRNAPLPFWHKAVLRSLLGPRDAHRMPTGCPRDPEQRPLWVSHSSVCSKGNEAWTLTVPQTPLPLLSPREAGLHFSVFLNGTHVWSPSVSYTFSVRSLMPASPALLSFLPKSLCLISASHLVPHCILFHFIVLCPPTNYLS